MNLTLEHPLDEKDLEKIQAQLRQVAESSNLSLDGAIVIFEIGPCSLSIENGALRFRCSF